MCDIGCDNGGRCTGPDQCECSPGYTGSHCQDDVDECRTEDPCGPDSVCVNMVGWYYCSCRAGFNSYHNPLDGTHSCVDEDECQQGHTCHPPAQCTNTPGGYTCSCPPGATCPSSCLVEGTRVEDGSSWIDGCSTCTCEQGRAVCQQTVCDCTKEMDSRCCPECRIHPMCHHQVIQPLLVSQQHFLDYL